MNFTNKEKREMKVKLPLALAGSLLTFCVGYHIGRSKQIREAYVLCEPITILKQTPEKVLIRDACGVYVTY